MNDPLSEVIALLRPRTVFSKRISGAGRWGVRYSAYGSPSFCTVLEGGCRLAVDGHAAIALEAGDFVLLPATPAFTLSGFEPVTPELIDPDVAAAAPDDVRHGRADGPPDVQLLGGYFAFDSPDAALLASPTSRTSVESRSAPRAWTTAGSSDASRAASGESKAK